MSVDKKRFSVTVTKEINDYLEKESSRIGLNKNSLILIAIEYYRQREHFVHLRKDEETVNFEKDYRTKKKADV